MSRRSGRNTKQVDYDETVSKVAAPDDGADDDDAEERRADPPPSSISDIDKFTMPQLKEQLTSRHSIPTSELNKLKLKAELAKLLKQKEGHGEAGPSSAGAAAAPGTDGRLSHTYHLISLLGQASWPANFSALTTDKRRRKTISIALHGMQMM